MIRHRQSAQEVDAMVDLCARMSRQLKVDQAKPRLTNAQGYLSHQLFAEADLAGLDTRLEFLSNESKTRLKGYIQLLRRRGPYIRLALAPPPSVIAPLRARFPNFGEVLDFVEGSLALAQSAGQSPLDLPPILLGGDPGLGKTFFARELATVLGTHFVEIPMASATGGFSLAGLDLGWSTGQAGQVFTTLVGTGIANPMMLLDEVDKTASNERHSVLGPLFGLLERGTAARFADEAVQLPMDASRILWMATGNDLHTIPDPILSRLQVFTVRAPTAAEGAQIAAAVYDDLRDQQPWGRSFPEALAPDVIEAIAVQPPRAMRRLLIAAACSAAKSGRQAIGTPDLQIQPPRRIGFV